MERFYFVGTLTLPPTPVLLSFKRTTSDTRHESQGWECRQAFRHRVYKKTADIWWVGNFPFPPKVFLVTVPQGAVIRQIVEYNLEQVSAVTGAEFLNPDGFYTCVHVCRQSLIVSFDGEQVSPVWG